MLREAGYEFARFDPPYADPSDPNDVTTHRSGDAASTALYLAQQKALSIPMASIPEGAVVITADTVGTDPAGRLIGTPESADQALNMLRGLVDAVHHIATGVVLRGGDGVLHRLADTAEVLLGPIDDEVLKGYVNTGHWRGKAGGYNLAERTAAGWPITVTGDPGTVMGLPMLKLMPLLSSLGVEPTQPADR